MSTTPNQKDLLAKKSDLEGILKPDDNDVLHLPDVTITLAESGQFYLAGIDKKLLTLVGDTSGNAVTLDGDAGLTFTTSGGSSTITGITSSSGNSTSLAASQSMASAKQDKIIAGNNIQIAQDGKTISATDTTYSTFNGASASADGSTGLVPKPLIADKDKYLRGDGTWQTIQATPALNDLTDVDLTTPADGQILKYDAVNQEWINANENPGVTELSGLTDVDVTTTTPTNGQGLVYNSTSEKWENANVLASASVSTLTDVNLTSLKNGQVLKYDTLTQKWVNAEDIDETNEFGPNAPTASMGKDGQIYMQYVNPTTITYSTVWTGLALSHYANQPAKVEGFDPSKYYKIRVVGVSYDANVNDEKLVSEIPESSTYSDGWRIGDRMYITTQNNGTELWVYNAPSHPTYPSYITRIEAAQPSEISKVYGKIVNNWIEFPSGSGSSTLTSLSDVNITTPTDGQGLVYNNTTQKWENGTVSSASSIDTLTDVNLTNLTNGQILKYNSISQEWENANESGGGGSSVTTLFKNNGTTSPASITLEDDLTNYDIVLFQLGATSGDAIFTMAYNVADLTVGDTIGAGSATNIFVWYYYTNSTTLTLRVSAGNVYMSTIVGIKLNSGSGGGGSTFEGLDYANKTSLNIPDATGYTYTPTENGALLLTGYGSASVICESTSELLHLKPYEDTYSTVWVLIEKDVTYTIKKGGGSQSSFGSGSVLYFIPLKNSSSGGGSGSGFKEEQLYKASSMSFSNITIDWDWNDYDLYILYSNDVLTQSGESTVLTKEKIMDLINNQQEITLYPYGEGGSCLYTPTANQLTAYSHTNSFAIIEIVGVKFGSGGGSGSSGDSFITYTKTVTTTNYGWWTVEDKDGNVLDPDEYIIVDISVTPYYYDVLWSTASDGGNHYNATLININDVYEIRSSTTYDWTITYAKKDFSGGGGGSSVTPNPTDPATDALTSIEIDGTVYSVGGGGSTNGFVKLAEYSGSGQGYAAGDTITLSDDMTNYDMLVFATNMFASPNVYGVPAAFVTVDDFKTRYTERFFTWYEDTTGYNDVNYVSDTSIYVLRVSRVSFHAVYGVKFGGSGSGGGGSSVTPNPQGTPTDTLSTIEIDGTIYDIEGSGGGSGTTTEEIYKNTTGTIPDTINLTKPINDFDIILITGFRSNTPTWKISSFYVSSAINQGDVIELNDDAYYAWYTVTDLSTLTKNVVQYDIIDTIYGLKFGSGGGNASAEEMTLTEYSVLTTEEKNDGTIRFIPESNIGYGLDIDFTNSTTYEDFGMSHTVNNNEVQIIWPDTSSAIGFTIYPTAKIDVTDYDFISYDLTSTSSYSATYSDNPLRDLGVGLKVTAPSAATLAPNMDYTVWNRYEVTDVGLTFTDERIDVSNLTGEYYLIIACAGWNATVNNIKLCTEGGNPSQIKYMDKTYGISSGEGSGYTEEVIYSATPTTAAPNTLTLTKPYTDFDMLLFNLYRNADGVMNKYDRVVLTSKLSLNDRIQLITYNEWASYDITTTTSFTLINENSMYIGSVVGLKFGQGSGGGGSTVIPNPTGTPTDTLDTVSIDGTIYDIEGSGGGGSTFETVFAGSKSTSKWAEPIIFNEFDVTAYDIIRITAALDGDSYVWLLDTDIIPIKPANTLHILGEAYCDRDNTSFEMYVSSSHNLSVSKIEGLVEGTGSSMVHYSTTEHQVGTWIDGSDVYEKTIVLRENGTNNYTYLDSIFSQSLPANINWINIESFYAKRGSGGWVDCMNNQQETILVPNPTTQGIYFYSQMSHTDIIVTIRYTKTT